jgi:hypothetical protein
LRRLIVDVVSSDLVLIVVAVDVASISRRLVGSSSKDRWRRDLPLVEWELLRFD